MQDVRGTQVGTRTQSFLEPGGGRATIETLTESGKGC
jgi:hypothetical protein